MLRRVHSPKPPMYICAEAAFTLEPAAGKGAHTGYMCTHLQQVRQVWDARCALMHAPASWAQT
jgi:hypothetical protein